ncbi:MAG: type II toxin-antitoxin system Phd/YefM family antitoxin [Verrucomicrobiales bacterium]|nr:type II toxin-antitoxin system Phd/YefM family antitoxin [Verrucomicrobiales bacterium]
MKKEWQLQEAKNRFSQVVKEALATGPQWVTRHGKRTVVILSAEEYATLCPEAESSWLEWMRRCPGGDLSDHLEDREQEEVGSVVLD